jgi:hypothetical protein
MATPDLRDPEMVDAENAARQERHPLTDDEVLALVRAEITTANTSWTGSMTGTRREAAINAYFGNPYGNEQIGRSQVVSRDTFEVIEWIIPDLMETFTSGDQIVRFDPYGPEDEEEAKQQTDLTNFTLQVENPIFRIIEIALRDGTVQDLGVGKVYWEDRTEVSEESFYGLTPEQLGLISTDPSLEVVALTPMPGEMGIIYDVTVRKTETKGSICIENVPPEEFIIDSDARDVETARFTAHRIRTTASVLRQMGVQEDVISRLGGFTTVDDSGEAIARRSQEDSEVGQSSTRDTRTDSERPIGLFDCWTLIDRDGDGVSELYRVVAAGTGGEPTEIISISMAEERPFIVWSPIRVPHRVNGLSIAWAIADLQEIRTAILRQYLDGLYLGNTPRTIVTGRPDGTLNVDIDSLLAVQPGATIVEYEAGAVRPFQTDTMVSQNAMQGLDLMKQMREERTGVNRFTQGMEAPEVNRTASGLMALQGAANKRIKFIARTFAEEWLKPLGKKVGALNRRYPQPAKAIRLRGKWINIDPTSWKHDYDAVVAVGLGYADKTESLVNMQSVAALQEKIGTLFPASVTYEQAFETVAETLRLMGYRNPARFATEPGQYQPPPPEMEVEEKEIAAKFELRQHEFQIKEKELELKELEIRLQHEVEMRKLGITETEHKLAANPSGKELQ